MKLRIFRLSRQRSLTCLGAGDTVVATLALALGCGADTLAAAIIANAAAGLAVGKQGTATVSARELQIALGGLKNLGDPKIVDAATAREIVSDWKRDGLVVGFTVSGFDLIYPGHVDLLRNARAACDRLVVALNTDASVKRLKGRSRPVQNEHARALVMSAINSADLVTFFDDNKPASLIEMLRPDCLIKGARTIPRRRWSAQIFQIVWRAHRSGPLVRAGRQHHLDDRPR